MSGRIINRVGEKGINNQGLEMTIIEYIRNNNITVRFTYNDEIVKSQYIHFKKGEIKSHLFPQLFGVGYMGIGEYKPKEQGVYTKQYKIWQSMLQRCYSDKLKLKYPTYKNCSVCEEWHNYQNFAKWHEENYYEVNKETMNLDKDILIKGNKLYSPETCIFVPKRINILFLKCDGARGDLPIGVHYRKSSNNYIAQCSLKEGKVKHLGCYTTPQQAFNAYKTFKEYHVKEIADIYKNKIPQKLYNAMYDYKVEITD